MRVWNIPLGQDWWTNWLPWGAPPVVPGQTPQTPGPSSGQSPAQQECARWAPQGYTWSEDQQACVLVAEKSWAQTMCEAMGGRFNSGTKQCEFGQDVVKGLSAGSCPPGSVKTPDGQCLPSAVIPSPVGPGTPSPGLTAKGTCVANGGSWNDANQSCTMPQAPSELSWWDKQTDSTKFLIVGGAAVGALALGALALGAFRKPYTPNPRRRTSQGGYRYDILWDRSTGKWRLVGGTSASRRGWKDLGLLAKPGTAYKKAMKTLGHDAERVRRGR